MRLLTLTLCLVAQSALGTEDAGTGVLTKAPALLKQVDAPFPASMLDAGVGGTVVMEVDIAPDGKVMDARVVQSAAPAFDEAALNAVRQFEFSPAEVDGQPAAVRIQYSYTFFFRPVVEQVDVVDAGVRVNFAGRVVERGTRDPVGGAVVVVGTQEAVTDEAGRFELKDVPIGAAQVTVAAADHHPYQVSEDFEVGKRTEVTYFIRRKVYGGYETVVRAPKERKEVAQVTLKQEEIRLIPGTAGDAFRVVQNLPGVARAPFGIGLLIVRGGKAWDTKTYVDEAPVPQLFHFGGLFSTFNANLLSDLSFEAGNFNADYGRAIGGLVTAQARTPSKKGFHGYLDVNVVDASALVEAPITPEWSFALSARRSYIDAVLPAVLNLIPGANDAIRFTLAPRYWDYQARVEWKPLRGRSRFFVTFFGSSDSLAAVLPNPAIDPEGRGDFGTSIVYNRLLLGFDTRLHDQLDFRTRTSAGINDFGFTLGTDIHARSVQYPVISRNTFTWKLPPISAELVFGVDLQLMPYAVDIQGRQVPKANQVPDPFTTSNLISERTFVFQAEPALFADFVWKPTDSLKVIAGLRGDYNSQMNKGWVDPRLSAVWRLSDLVTVKGGAGIFHQPPDYRFGQLSPVFGTPGLRPEGAHQFMVGSEWHFTDALSLDVQLYYKNLFDQVRSTLGENSGSDSNFSTVYSNVGRGRSYGAELLLRHALTKNFFGWISYSLARSERDYNANTAFGPSRYDQPHNLVVVASYKLPFDFIVGAKLRYTSGPLVRPVLATIYDANANYFYPVQSPTFSRRLPDFFQLDVRVDKRFVFQDWMFAIYLDVQNATYMKNVEALTYSYDYSQEAYFTGLPILPVLGLRGEW